VGNVNGGMGGTRRGKGGAQAPQGLVHSFRPRNLLGKTRERRAADLGRAKPRSLRKFDCGWSLLNHGVADTKRLNLGNLNPIYERELTKLELHQGEGRLWVDFGSRG